MDAAVSSRTASNESWSALDTTKFSLDKHGMEFLRASLGHPLNVMQPATSCVVSSVHGLDVGSSSDRFLVACRLWAGGISAEYLTQSGVMASLLHQQREDSQSQGTSVSSRSLWK